MRATALSHDAKIKADALRQFAEILDGILREEYARAAGLESERDGVLRCEKIARAMARDFERLNAAA